MAKRRSYDDKFRASAVLMFEADGNYTRVARHLGISRSTLRSWVNAKNGTGQPQGKAIPADVYHDKKVELSDLLDMSIRDALGYLPDKWSEATAREIAVSVGIFTDKKQLLEGGPTERTEHLNSDQRRDRIAELFETARARRDRIASDS